MSFFHLETRQREINASKIINAWSKWYSRVSILDQTVLFEGDETKTVEFEIKEKISLEENNATNICNYRSVVYWSQSDIASAFDWPRKLSPCCCSCCLRMMKFVLKQLFFNHKALLIFKSDEIDLLLIEVCHQNTKKKRQIFDGWFRFICFWWSKGINKFEDVLDDCD